jgi:hypothetical protein
MITREQIKKTLDEIYDAEYGDGENELKLADGVTFWLQNGGYPFDVIETIVDAVYELSGKPRNALGWYRPDRPDGYTSISVALPVTTEEEAIDAVAYFLRLLGVPVEGAPAGVS